MSAGLDTAAELVADADAAIRKHDLKTALGALEQAALLAPCDLSLWIKLASLQRASGDKPGSMRSIRRALTIDPLDFVALLSRASLLEDAGDPHSAEAYAIALAHQPAELPPMLMAAVERATRVHLELQNSEYEKLTFAAQAAAPSASPEEVSRMKRFASNIVRKTQAYRSNPSHFDYPGLAQRELHDRSTFPWIAEFESKTDEIAADLGRVMVAERAELLPYVQYDDDIPMEQWRELNGSSDWTAIHLLRNGRPVENNTRHCPATMAAIARLPLPNVAGRMPNAMFSLLAPHTHIPPHHGVANTRLVCHLPLIVPDGCWFRVGAETISWYRGKAIVFDDTIEHEAANPTDQLRVVLIVDIWHPGLNASERAGVAALMALAAITDGGSL